MGQAIAMAEGGTTTSPVTRAPAAPHLSGTPGKSLFAATLGFFFGFAAVALFGPTAGRFQEVMHLSPLMVAFLVAIPSLSGSLLRIPFSAWVDTTGGRKPFLVLLTLSVIGMAGVLAVKPRPFKTARKSSFSAAREAAISLRHAGRAEAVPFEK